MNIRGRPHKDNSDQLPLLIQAVKRIKFRRLSESGHDGHNSNGIIEIDAACILWYTFKKIKGQGYDNEKK
mgnify:CR=1 FL=1